MAVADLEGEPHVEPLQGERAVDVEEVDGEHAVACVRTRQTYNEQTAFPPTPAATEEAVGFHNSGPGSLTSGYRRFGMIPPCRCGCCT